MHYSIKIPHDRDYIRAAIEIAVDRVLNDPSDPEILLAVEEIVGDFPPLWGKRIRPAVIAAYNQAEAALGEGRDSIENSEALVIERRVVSVFGLS